MSDQERAAKAEGQNNAVIILPFGSAIQGMEISEQQSLV
jgi:hypothetical protein